MARVASSNRQDGPPETPIVIALRPLASALPLGFFAFGIGMLLLAALGIGWIEETEARHVGLLLASYVFPLELAAAILGFVSRDVFAGTGLGLFSTSWLALGLALLTGAPGTRNGAIGIYLLGFGAALLPLAVAAFLGKPLIGAILLTAAGRSVLAGIYELGGSTDLNHAAGILAAAVAGVAWYAGAAFLLEDMHQRPVLPTFRRGASRESLEGSLREQLERARGDAGIRQQL
jgi:succinate-acetate transporter protein